MPCRTDWRPSACLVGALCVLGLLGAASVWASGLPDGWRASLALLSLAWGAGSAWREARRPGACLLLGRQGAFVQQGQGGWETLAAPRLQVRGPLVQLRARRSDGRPLYLLWWPDTLPPAARRRLRLATRVSLRSDIPHASVAA